MSIDLNADVGEGMNDADLLPWVTSANVACGYHAGDPGTMDRTVSLALGRGVRVGAHPGYPDRESFGRARFEMAPEEIESMVLYQVAALDGIVRSRGGTLTHVKPHGALYHRAAESGDVARAIARGVQRCRAGLILVGPAGSRVLDIGREIGLPVAGEAFADRRYGPDGTLVSREQKNALLTDPLEAADQAVSIARDGRVTASDGSRVSLRADTICLHGDTPGAPAIAKRVHERLREEGIRVAPLEAARAEGRAIPTIPPG
ncbi:MAG TPA: 5-oxoprolinase subunit PxpA [Thermoanaerobaculia bacterium]